MGDVLQKREEDFEEMEYISVLKCEILEYFVRKNCEDLKFCNWKLRKECNLLEMSVG